MSLVAGGPRMVFAPAVPQRFVSVDVPWLPARRHLSGVPSGSGSTILAMVITRRKAEEIEQGLGEPGISAPGSLVWGQCEMSLRRSSGALVAVRAGRSPVRREGEG